jgi:hypothetical protein
LEFKVFTLFQGLLGQIGINFADRRHGLSFGGCQQGVLSRAVLPYLSCIVVLILQLYRPLYIKLSCFLFSSLFFGVGLHSLN